MIMIAKRVLLLALAAGALSARQMLGFEHSASNIPSDEKKDKGGEDSWYVNDYLLSVADGVGGWNLQGVDPAKYSRKLEANVKLYFARDESGYRANPKRLMEIAAQNDKETGSSTFVIATIDPEEPKLRVGFLGDSGYMIVRRNAAGVAEVNYRSTEQQHKFNFPFQCGTNGDPISSALEFTHDIQPNDLVIMATDGLWDNVFDNEIINIVEEHKSSQLQQITDAIANFAYKKSKDKKFMSPFAKGAIQAGYRFAGGKEDDITVVAGIVREAIET